MGFFNLVLGINQENVQIYLEKSVYTEMGHLDQVPANTQ